jgi:hypothetical protein
MENKDSFKQDKYHESQGTNSNDQIGNREGLDSKVNTDFSASRDPEDLTNDESADTDPNKVANKPTFKSNSDE